jgi:endonuclease YncB( thermonuclease family)
MDLAHLRNATHETPSFGLQGQVLQGKIVEIYDGDTCKIVLPMDNKCYKFTCRLYGIDAPEMKPGKDVEHRDTIIYSAQKARDAFFAMVCHPLNNEKSREALATNTNLVTVKCRDFDKYGRLLVEIYLDEQCASPSINERLCTDGFAVSRY